MVLLASLLAASEKQGYVDTTGAATPGFNWRGAVVAPALEIVAAAAGGAVGYVAGALPVMVYYGNTRVEEGIMPSIAGGAAGFMIGGSVSTWLVGSQWLKQGGDYWGALGGALVGTAATIPILIRGEWSVGSWELSGALIPLCTVGGYNLSRLWSHPKSPKPTTWSRLKLPSLAVSPGPHPTVGLSVLRLSF